jgi:hypothetical protein
MGWLLKGVGLMDEAGNTVDSERMKWKNLGQGVSTTIVAAFDPSIAGMLMLAGGDTKLMKHLDQNGAYLADCKVEDTPEEWMQDPEGPEKLWKLSERLVEQEFAASA